MRRCPLGILFEMHNNSSLSSSCPQLPSITHFNSLDQHSNMADYSLPPVQVAFDGFLFDMDGTIIDSTAAVVKHWHT